MHLNVYRLVSFPMSCLYFSLKMFYSSPMSHGSFKAYHASGRLSGIGSKSLYSRFFALAEIGINLGIFILKLPSVHYFLFLRFSIAALPQSR